MDLPYQFDKNNPPYDIGPSRRDKLMKEDIELAKAILGPRMNAQIIDGPLKRPLEQLARAVLAMADKVSILEQQIQDREKRSDDYALDGSPKSGSPKKSGDKVVIPADFSKSF